MVRSRKVLLLIIHLFIYTMGNIFSQGYVLALVTQQFIRKTGIFLFVTTPLKVRFVVFSQNLLIGYFSLGYVIAPQGYAFSPTSL